MTTLSSRSKIIDTGQTKDRNGKVNIQNSEINEELRKMVENQARNLILNQNQHY